MRTQRLGRHTVDAARRVVERTVHDRRLPPYVGEIAGLQLRTGLHRARGALTGARARRGAVPFPGGSVEDLAAAHLALTTAVLDDAGIAYVVYRAGAYRYAVAVDGAVRAAARRAFDLAGGDVRVHGDGAPLGRADAWLVYRDYREGDRVLSGADQACRVEFWVRTGNEHRQPGYGTDRLAYPLDDDAVALDVGARSYASVATLTRARPVGEADFPVDAVYLWVDGNDPVWRAAFEATRAAWRDDLHPLSANPSRYQQRDELRYSLRSLDLYAPFVRRVYVVTAGHLPPWLDRDDGRFVHVRHEDVFDASCLPTFNSHAIESRLHHIDGLSEHYLVLNDDVFFGRPVAASDFFVGNGIAKFFLSPAVVPPGPATADDAPVDAAAKNARDLLARVCGVRVDHKVQHVPLPQRRSVQFEMEERFAAEFAAVAASRFRRPSDLSVATSLFPYYAYATDRAVPGEIEGRYVNIGDRWARVRMADLLAERACAVFCLNETDASRVKEERVDGMVQSFLDDYFPFRSRFERDQ